MCTVLYYIFNTGPRVQIQDMLVILVHTLIIIQDFDESQDYNQYHQKKGTIGPAIKV